MSSTLPLPYFPPKGTQKLMDHFDENVYSRSEKSHLYRFLEALSGSAGAGDLNRQSLLLRLQSSVESLQFRDIDSLFSNLFRLNRLPEESYSFNPTTDSLTSDQWDEVKVKDEAYKNRSVKFLEACTVASTVEGFRLVCEAILGVSADIFEVWKYAKNPTISGDLGRAATLTGTGRFINEVVVMPHKVNLSSEGTAKLLRFLDLVKPQDSIVTVDPRGLSVHKEITPGGVGATDSYFEVQKFVTGVPDLASIPEPEYLAEEVWDQKNWLSSDQEKESPTTALNSTQEFSLVYRPVPVQGRLGGTGITRISYQSQKTPGSERVKEPSYQIEAPIQKWTEWLPVPKADSPDNYPGGKFGTTPFAPPARTQNGKDYLFKYSSQSEFFEEFKTQIEEQDGEFLGETAYRLPISNEVVQKEYLPSNSLATEELLNSRTTTPWFRGKEG